MRRELQAVERECGFIIPGRWGGPGASARGCWAAPSLSEKSDVFGTNQLTKQLV